MSEKSSYEILGVLPAAGDDEIRSAYRKLAVRYHPDKNPDDAGAADRFREITGAYETIRDAERRRAYDQSRIVKPAAGAAPPPSGHGSAGFDLADALRAFMSTMRTDTALRDSFEGAGADPLRGTNVQMTIPLTLHDVALGAQKPVTIKHLKVCKTCNGNGATDARPALSPCRQCGGHGIVRIAGRTDTVKCPVCQGSAREVLNACPSCKGSGRTPGETVLSVKFPPGIGEGNFVSIAGKGDAGYRSASAGDLHIYIEEIPDTQFRRQGYDLETDATIPITTAVLGGRCMAMTLDGDTVSLRIPEGTQPETLFSLKGCGLPRYKGQGKGNLYVRVHVKVPDKLTAQEREYYEGLSRIMNSGDRRASSGNVDTSWVIRQSGDAWIINGGVGEFNDTVFEKPEVAPLLSQTGIRIGIDLSTVKMIHSLTVGLWMKLWRRLQNQKSELFLINPNRDVHSVLVDMNMHAVFTIVQDDQA